MNGRLELVAHCIGHVDDVGEALDLPPDRVQVTLVEKARGGITITATS